eukprot:scaffold2532_cov243-Pinguiococcus_pyrenoidosus.AAC.4
MLTSTTHPAYRPGMNCAVGVKNVVGGSAAQASDSVGVSRMVMLTPAASEALEYRLRHANVAADDVQPRSAARYHNVYRSAGMGIGADVLKGIEGIDHHGMAVERQGAGPSREVLPRSQTSRGLLPSILHFVGDGTGAARLRCGDETQRRQGVQVYRRRLRDAQYWVDVASY